MAGMHDEGRQWYVVTTFIGHENRVKESIIKRIESMNLTDYLFNIIVPEVEETKIENGKTITTKENIYPGYIFADMIMSDDAWYIVRNTTGVTGFIGSSGKGAKPFPVIQEEIEPVLKRLGIKPELTSVDYEVGDEVVVTSESFNGFVGPVVSIDMAKQEVVILSQLLGKQVEVTLHLADVKKVD